MGIKNILSSVKKIEKKVNFGTKVKSSTKRELDIICKKEGITQAELLEAFVMLYKQEEGGLGDCINKNCNE